MAKRHDPSREIVSLGCAENLALPKRATALQTGEK